MKIVLAMALTLVSLTVVPAASASEPITLPVEPVICPILECLIVAPPQCVYNYYATVCAYSANGCLVVMADGNARPVTVGATVPGQSIWTPQIDAGPVHVGSTHIWTDSVTVSRTVWTPDNGASNTLCYWEYADAILSA